MRRAPPLVRPMADGEQRAVAAALADAFDRDPLAQWLYPDAGKRLAKHLGMFESAAQGVTPNVLIDVTDDLQAAAIWHPPGHPRNWDAPPDAAPAAAELFAALGATMPSQPFWYLEFLGARTAGSGGGSALMRHRLGLLSGPVVLWTANEANMGFYQRFGCAVVGRVGVAGATAWWLERA